MPARKRTAPRSISAVFPDPIPEVIHSPSERCAVCLNVQRRDLPLLLPDENWSVNGIGCAVPRLMTRTPTHRRQAEVLEKGKNDVGVNRLVRHEALHGDENFLP